MSSIYMIVDEDKTALTNIADIKSCRNTRRSPFYKACQNGHDSTVQLIPKKCAYIDIYEKDRVSPLYISGNYGLDIFRKFYLTMARIPICALLNEEVL